MPENEEGDLQRPIELFGRLTDLPCPTTGHWKKLKEETAENPYRDFPCPFNEKPCMKIRKAEPNPLIGSCVVRKRRGKTGENWVVCPKRFQQDDVIFKDCLSLLTGKSTNIYFSGEIGLGSYGNLDFGIIGFDGDGTLVDFLGVEVQAMGTSGSGPIWDARNDYLSGNLKSVYNYGMNLRDASKKILVQLLHKGAQLSRWRFSLVLVIQDFFLDHLRSTYNLDVHFHSAHPQDFVHIHAYSLVRNPETSQYSLKLKESLSTDIVGLTMALIGNPAQEYLEFARIEQRILQRKSDGLLSKL